jgi:hypothetical protein
MTFRTSPLVPPLVSGPAEARGRALAALGAAQAAAVRARAEAALAVLATHGAGDWARRQWQAQQALLPEVAQLIEGMAAGFGLPVEALFAAHLRYAVEDRAAAAAAGEEGCTAFAVAGGGGALLAKNRDNPPALAPMQQLVRQRDPAWEGREILCLGSIGSAPAASSGMNSDGFCLADTAVRSGDLGLGALRYYVMEALLGRVATVAQAIAAIRAMPHVGGGTLLMADADGAVAVVEFGHRGLSVQQPDGTGWVARTNHHLDPTLAAELRESPGCGPRDNSESRLAWLSAQLAAAPPRNAAGCAVLLSRHEGDGFAALCRHGDPLTLSGAVFEPAARRLSVSRGHPCGGDWRQAGFG